MKRIDFLAPEDVHQAIATYQGRVLRGSSQRSELKRAFFIFLAVVIVVSSTSFPSIYATSPFTESFVNTTNINTTLTTATVDTVHSQTRLTTTDAWTNVMGFTNGENLSDVKFAPGSTTVGWVVTKSGGIYKTSDGGTTWAIQNSGTSTPLNIVSFVDENTGFVAGGTTNGTTGILLKTSNGGTTWAPVTPAGAPTLNDVIVTSTLNAWAIGYTGTIYRTTDGGGTWTTQTLSGITQILYAIGMSGSTGIIVGNGGKILKSTDAGVTWTERPPAAGLETTLLPLTNLFNISLITADTAWISGAGGSILKTTNASGAFTLIFQSLGQTGNGAIDAAVDAAYPTLYRGFTDDFSGLSFADSSTGMVTTIGGVIIKSIDGGTTWTPLLLANNKNLYNIIMLSTTLAYTAGDGATLLKTTNGGTGSATSWTTLAQGHLNDLNDIDFSSSNDGVMVGSEATVVVTHNGGTTWYGAAPPGAATENLLATGVVEATTTIWIASNQGKIYKTTNEGASYTTQTSGVSTALNHIEVLNANDLYIAGDNGVILKTTDGGATAWSLKSTGTSANLNEVAFPVDATTGWAIGASGTILKTTDSGATWVAPLAANIRNTDGVAVLNITGNTLNAAKMVDNTTGWIAGSAGLILKTTDGGTIWVKQTIATTDNLTSIVVIDANTVWVTARTDTLWQTTNGGTAWTNRGNPGTYGFMASAKASATSLWFVGQQVGMVQWVSAGDAISLKHVDSHKTLRDVEGIGDAVYAAGFNQQVMKSTDAGVTWSSVDSGSYTQDLYGVAVADASTAWAVGPGGLIRKTITGGNSWTTQDAGGGFTGLFQDVDAASTSVAWAVANGGVVRRTIDGGATAWVNKNYSVATDLKAVNAFDANTAIAVGNSGTIIKTIDGGSTWTAQTSGTSQNLNGVYFVDANTGWATGNNGTILKGVRNPVTDITTWTAQTNVRDANNVAITPFTDLVDRIGCSDVQTCYTVTDTGRILHTIDGGTTWKSVTGVKATNAIWVKDFETVVAVGGGGHWAARFTPTYPITQQVVVSTNQQTDTSLGVSAAILTPMQTTNGQTIAYYVSNTETSNTCGTSPWMSAPSGTAVNFTAVETKLFWCATLQSNSTSVSPRISQVVLAYTTATLGGGGSRRGGGGDTPPTDDTHPDTGCTINCAPTGPSAPTALPATTISSTQIQWNFQDNPPDIESGFILSEQQSGGILKELIKEQTRNITSILEFNLTPNTRYANRVIQANGSTASTPVPLPPGTTRADVPLTPVYALDAGGSPTLAIAVAQNPLYTELAIHEKNTNLFLQANGTFSNTPQWRAFEKWGNVITNAGGVVSTTSRVIFLSIPTNSSYIFEVKARNLDNIETTYSGITTAVLPIEPVQKVEVRGEASSGVDLAAVSTALNGEFTNLSNGQAGIHFQLHKSSDSIIFKDEWVKTPLFSVTDLARSTAYMVRAQSRNEVGAVTPWSVETTFITSATDVVSVPEVATPINGQVFTSSDVIISGTASTLATVEIDLGTHTYDVPVNAVGQWSKSLNLTPGAYTAKMKTILGAKQSTVVSRTFSVSTVVSPPPPGDDKKPPVDATLPIQPGKPTFTLPHSNSLSPTVIRSSPVEFKGTAPVGTSVQVRFDTKEAIVNVSAQGTWEVLMDVVHPESEDGPITAWAQSFTGSGASRLSSDNTTLDLVIDRTPIPPPPPPQLQDAVITPPTAIFSGIAPVGTRVEVRVVNSTGTPVSKKTTLAVGKDGNWVSTASLADGEYILETQTINPEGVRSETSAKQSFTVASAEQTPAAPIFIQPTVGSTLNTSTVTINGTAPATTSVEVRFAAQQQTIVVQPINQLRGSWNASFTISSSIADGPITAWATSIASDGVHRSTDSQRSFILQRTVITPPEEKLPEEKKLEDEKKTPPLDDRTPPAGDKITPTPGPGDTTSSRRSTGEQTTTPGVEPSTTTTPSTTTSSGTGSSQSESGGRSSAGTLSPPNTTIAAQALSTAGLNDLAINGVRLSASPDLPILALTEPSLVLSGQSTLPNGQVTVTLYSDPISTTVQSDSLGNWSTTLNVAQADPIVQHTLTVKTKLGSIETPETTLAYITIPSTNAILNTLPQSVAGPLVIAATTVGEATQVFVENVIAPAAEVTKKVVVETVRVTKKAAIKTAEVTVKTAQVTHEAIVKAEPQTKATLATALPIVAVINPPVVASLPSIPFMIYHFFTWLFTFLGLKKRREPWGVVYDGITKEPVALAIVRLMDTQTKRIVETQVTDRQGRFGFLVKPGVYRIEANKTGYHYPSTIVSSMEDGEYQPVYHQEQFTVSDDKQVVAMAVPLDPVNFAGSVHTSLLKSLWNQLHHYGRKLHLPVMVAGSLVALAVAVNVPTLTNTLMAMGYAFMTILQNLLTPAAPKPWGVVYDAQALTPVALALVDIIDTKYNKLLKSRLSDYEGRFTFLPPKGTYKLNVRKSGFKFPVPEAKPQKTFQHPYHGEEIALTKDAGYIAKDVPVAPVNPVNSASPATTVCPAACGIPLDSGDGVPPEGGINPVSTSAAPAPSSVAMSEHHVLLGKDHEANVGLTEGI